LNRQIICGFNLGGWGAPRLTAMPDGSGGHSRLRQVLGLRDFRRLLLVRLVGQTADGLLQVGLASFVFFSPERAATPARVAFGFALLLLPFSVVGPFAGVLLDRWRRRQVLVVANVLRFVGMALAAVLVATGGDGPALYALALVVLGINRFVLAALGASLPHVVPERLLVTANAVAPTAGTALSFVGALIGVVLSTALGGGDGSDGVVIALAAVTCAAAALCATRLAVDTLGPDVPVHVSLRSAVSDVAVGVAAGLRHLRERVPAERGLTVMGGHRLLFGAVTVMSIVLFRNTFYPGDPEAALAALGSSLAVGGAGAVTGAVLPPVLTRRIGSARWMGGLLLMAAVVAALTLPTFALPAYLVAAFAIGVTAQGLKVSVDSLVQTFVSDTFRGRVFTIYDVVFNATFVIAGLIVALTVPLDGESLAVAVGVSVGYAALGLWYLRAGRLADRTAPVTDAGGAQS
jgi:MFS family permease